MDPFEIRLPAPLVFGAGEFRRLGAIVRPIGRRPLVVAGRASARGSGLLDRALSLLRDAGLAPALFEGIEPNPTASSVDAAARLARECGADSIVALGGGSAMDAAKGAAGVAVSGGSIRDYCRRGAAPPRPFSGALPVVAVPTLAGTGSEANEYGVVNLDERSEKLVFNGPPLLPRAALVDPLLTLSAPRAVIADGGMDMTAHLLETYFTGNDASPVSDRLTFALLESVVEALPRALADPSDPAPRATLSWVSSLALSGIPSAGREGPFPLHAMEHPLSGHYDLPHGRGLAILLPHLVRFTTPARPERTALLWRKVFGSERGSDPSDPAGPLVDWMRSHGLLRTLGEHGIVGAGGAFERLADEAVRNEGNAQGVLENPRPLLRKDVLEVYRAAQ